MDNIYLSIDIDYWVNSPQYMKAFLRKALSLGVPTTVVISHEELIPHINASKAKTVINVDYHSDLADDPQNSDLPLELMEGTWGNFVNFKKDGTFIWVYPNSECWVNRLGKRGSGRCDESASPFIKNSEKICGWKRAKRRKRKLLTKEEWKNVDRVGISMSPDWITNYMCWLACVELMNQKAMPLKVLTKLLHEFSTSGDPLQFSNRIINDFLANFN